MTTKKIPDITQIIDGISENDVDNLLSIIPINCEYLNINQITVEGFVISFEVAHFTRIQEYEYSDTADSITKWLADVCGWSVVVSPNVVLSFDYDSLTLDFRVTFLPE